MKGRTPAVVFVMILLPVLLQPSVLSAQDVRGTSTPLLTTSPFAPPKANDHTFVVNDGAGLDTGCTYRSGGPLVITLPIKRVLGDLAALERDGLVPSTVRLEFPAYDVDSSGGSGSVPNEVDNVSFNGKKAGVMTGLNNTWVMQRFDVKLDDLKLPADPGAGKTVTAASNTIQIDIDTASGSVENWCTAVDWVSISIDGPVPPRPWVGVHGIFSDNSIWDNLWVPAITSHGIPAYHGSSMGNLDSIQNNATKVATEVQNAINRWGVDKVNVMAHSKGGIDTRHFAEGNDKIENLVQLGTPNAGSPLADAIQAGTIVGLGVAGNFAANLLAGGVGGYQLTTLYMKRYNSLHGSNPNTRYHAVAGLYTPGTGLSDLIRRALIAVVGPGDTIVPEASVHALPFTINYTVSSTYPDAGSTHTSIHSYQPAYNLVQGVVLGAGAPLVAMPYEIEQEEAALAGGSTILQRTPSKVGRVNAGQTQDQTIAVDAADGVGFTLFASDGSLTFTITDPNGATYTPASTAASFDKSQIPGGWAFSYSFNSPITGNWVAHVQNTSAAAIDYTITAWLTNAVLTMTPTTPATLSLNQAMTIRAQLQRGAAAVTGATVQAFVRNPAGALTSLMLADNGVSPDTTANDGIYSGNFAATSAPGVFDVVLQAASAPGSPQPFAREGYAQVTVSASTSKLLAAITDFGKDTNANGRYEQLVVRVPVQITSSRAYRWSGTLRDSAGHQMDASASGNLTTGTTSIDLPFDGQTILLHGVNGPYTLAAFTLAEEINNDVLPVSSLATPYSTQAYLFTAFEGPNITGTGSADAQGVDSNNNGKFDVLRVTIGLSKHSAGSYSWSARLRDGNNVEIVLGSNQGSLTAGTSNITIDFDGHAIGQYGADGPYAVTDLLVLGPDGTLSVANVMTTPAFTASQFEGYVAPAATPSFTPGAGAFPNVTQVAMASATSGATIRYTTDGSDPTSSSTAYAGVLTLTATTTLRARAFSPGLKDSAIATGTFTIVPTAMKLGHASLAFGGVHSGGSVTSLTPSQSVTVSFDGLASGWTASSPDPWIQVTSAAGTGHGSFVVSVNQGAAGASAAGSVTVTPALGGIPVQTLPVSLGLRPGVGAIPFGVFDTPVGDATPLAGSISVTGWTLDDVGVKRVELWRDLQPGETTPPFNSTPSDPRNGKVFISNATFVDGARPDVEALYASTPFSYRAGWGYLLLTWGLWNQGNGTYTLHAFAFDQEDNIARIGSKTIVVNNSAAAKPFGSIDTPAIGSDPGTSPNFGWALTPKVNGVATCTIPSNGVQVSIDSGPLQPVVYGDARSDIAGAFPGFSNSAGAGGHFLFDWSTLVNGPHTIGWLITDDCNRADGVGSRFFNVTTGSSLVASGFSRNSSEGVASAFRRNDLPESAAAITVARGYGELPLVVDPGLGGSRTIDVKQGERIEIRLPRGYDAAYQLGPDGQSRALPTGSAWDGDSGIFAWQPAAGFLGRFRLVFSDGRERINVRVVVVP